MSNWKYLEEKARISEEVYKAINTAGGSVESFDLHAITEFIYACQCNNIEIFRDRMYGAYHISYVAPDPEGVIAVSARIKKQMEDLNKENENALNTQPSYTSHIKGSL
jgi:hypothetical protein